MKRKFLLLILFSVLSLAISAQFLPFRNFQAKDGLPSSEVYFVMQDHLGYMWFGTDAGISRYDGYSFQNFTTNDGLCDNTVFQLFEDRHQRIWCRTISGCTSYFENGRFTTIGASTAIRGEMGNLLLTELYIDDNDTLWLGTQNKKIIRVAPPYTAQSMRVFQDSSTQVRIFNHGIVYSKGDMIGGQKGTTARVNFKNQSGGLLEADTVADFFITRCVREDAEKTLIAFGKKLYRFGNGRLTEIFSSDAIILSIYKDQQGRLWLGLIDNGLVILEQQHNVYRVSHRYLGNDRLSFVTRDYEGGTWISSLKNGVFYLPRQGIEQYTGNSGGDNRMISVVSLGGRIFTSNYNGELLALKPDSMNPETEKIPLVSKFINKKLFPKGNDTLLIANVSLEIFETKKNKMSVLLDTLQHGTLTDMMREHGNNWWVANPVKVALVNVETGERKDTFSIPGTRVNCLFYKNDTLWLGCLDGLWIRVNKKLEFLGRRFPALRNRIDDIEEIRSNTLALATRSSGVILFDRRSCRMIGTAEGLSSPICRSLLPAGPDQVWVGTNNGLNLLRLLPVPHVSRLISSGDGLVASDIAQMCFSGRKLCAATTNGIFVIDTVDCFHVRDIAPMIHMNAVLIREKAAPLDSSFDVNYDQNTVQFDFLGISFKSRGRMVYRYRLEGLDTAWTVSSSTFARYGSLAPGDYRFVVYAVNGNGLSSSLPQTVSLHIRKPYWRTWWFISGSIGLFLLLTWLVIRSRVKRARMLARKDAEFKQRLAETELKALRAQMNPHFVFNAIGSIQNFILNNKNEDANKYLLVFAQLIRNVLEQSKEELITLQQEINTLKLYLGIESLRFKNKFNWKISPDENLDSENILIPPLLLQPFVENALWHGLMTMEEHGELIVTIRAEGDKLVCLVEDNGIGRKASGELKKSRNLRQSLGTTISKDRLETMELLLGRKTELEITDLYTADGRACGTRVRIALPLFKLS